MKEDVGVHRSEFLLPASCFNFIEHNLTPLPASQKKCAGVAPAILNICLKKCCHLICILVCVSIVLSGCSGSRIIRNPENIERRVSIPDSFGKNNSEKDDSGKDNRDNSGTPSYNAALESTGLTAGSGDGSPLKQNATVTKWWESFGSSELNTLMDSALDENFTLKVA